MTGKKSILLVEDNPDDIELNLRAIRKCNITDQIVVARDGVEALDFLFGRGAHAGRDTSETPTVVLLDLKLPKVSGLEVLEHLRNDPRTRLIPVIVLTSSSQDRDIVESYGLGCNSYIRKPVDYTEFVQTVQQLEQYWLRLNQPPPRRPTVQGVLPGR